MKIDSITQSLRPDDCSLYYDGFQICFRSCNMSITERQLQLCQNKLKQWTTDNGFRFSTIKTLCMHICQKRSFHLDPQVRFQYSPTFVPYLKYVKRRFNCFQHRFFGYFGNTLVYQTTEDCAGSGAYEESSYYSWKYETGTVIIFLFIQKNHAMGIMWHVLHTHLTHSYILKKDPPPLCEHCQCILTVRHILVECNNFSQTRNDICGIKDSNPHMFCHS